MHSERSVQYDHSLKGGWYVKGVAHSDEPTENYPLISMERLSSVFQLISLFLQPSTSHWMLWFTFTTSIRFASNSKKKKKVLIYSLLNTKQQMDNTSF